MHCALLSDTITLMLSQYNSLVAQIGALQSKVQFLLEHTAASEERERALEEHARSSPKRSA